MADTAEPPITKVALGDTCSTCGDGSLSARSTANGTKTSVYHNKCGHMQDVAIPWATYVKNCFDGGAIRYGSDGQTLMEQSAMRPGMEKHVYQDPNKKKEGCFIATAVYGSPAAQQVIVLRTFRDDRLARSTFGRVLIALYYQISPAVAVRLKDYPRITCATRVILDSVVHRLRKRSQ